MPQPAERDKKPDTTPARRLQLEERKELLRKKEERDRRGGVPKNTDKMIAGRREKKGRVIKGVTEALQRAVKIGSRRVREKKMLKTLADQAPAANERIAQDEGLIVPDESVSQGWRVGHEGGSEQQDGRENMFSAHPPSDWTLRSCV